MIILVKPEVAACETTTLLPNGIILSWPKSSQLFYLVFIVIAKEILKGQLIPGSL